MDNLLVILGGIVAIGFVVWFFLLKREHTVTTITGTIDIRVDGGYIPSAITVPVGRSTTFVFFRKDPSPCLEEVVFPDFGIRQSLALNKKTSVTITPKARGQFQYSCGMNMIHGTIVVE